ncbi:MAG TPA: PDZ domain-containing protein [Anaerolineae bacterium]|nr:PDZ domain-containing protein [Anaerolineae bacterium]
MELPVQLNGMAWLAVIPVLGVLVFVHELGHFLAARLVKVKVEEFGFGYPPRILTLFERNGVKYTLNWLPLGGFVRMVGEEGNFDAEGSLFTKQPWQRAIVLLAGPLMNFLVAPLIFALAFNLGMPQFEGPVRIEQVATGSPAERAGLQPGDIILQVGDVHPRTLVDVSRTTDAYRGREMPVLVRRGDETIAITVVPRLVEEVPPGQGATGITIGFVPDEVTQTTVRLPWGEALVTGVRHTIFVVGLMVAGLADLIRGLIMPAVSLPPGGIAGPVGIARLTGEVVRHGLNQLLEFTAFLSINLGLINLLPLPALDGGRLVFVILEAIRRGKRIAPEREALVHLAGMMALIALMLIISYFDLTAWLRGEAVLPGM